MNPALVGTAYPTISFEVSADRVASFAFAIGDDGSFVPPTFLTVPEILSGLMRAIGDEDLGLDLERVLHAEQEYGWRRPLEIGETLRVTSEIESIRAKGGVELLVLRTEFREPGGAPVATARSTLIVRRDRP